MICSPLAGVERRLTFPQQTNFQLNGLICITNKLILVEFRKETIKSLHSELVAWPTLAHTHFVHILIVVVYSPTFSTGPMTQLFIF